MGRGVLVIDTCAATKTTFRSLFNGAYPLCFASDACEGLSLLSEAVCLVFLSLDCTGPCGLSALRQIKRAYPSIPVIATAADGTEELCLAAFRSGARDYMKKPLDAEEVLQRVQTFAALPLPSRRRTHVPLMADTPADDPHLADIPSKIIQGIEKVRQHIDVNFNLPLTLEEACRLSAICRTYFCCYFKQVTGYSFKSYQNRVKMLKAGELISSGVYTMADIAQKLGYSDASSFSAAFKKALGRSPREHRADR